MAADYDEVADSTSPADAGMGQEGGRATVLYNVDDPANLEDSLLDLLGYVHTTPQNLWLRRELPRAHPRWPWLFVERVSSIKGRGTNSAESAEPFLEAPTVEGYAVYDEYQLQAQFEARPYAVLGDSEIQTAVSQITYYAQDGSATSVTYAPEWLRFCEWFEEPFVELLTAEAGGGLKFRTSSGNPGGYTVPGGPQMKLAKKKVICRWHHVPYRYITSNNSKLASPLSAGSINQAEWCGFPAGSLLYEGASVNKLYTQPFPDLVFTTAGATTFSTEKTCTLDVKFEFVDRTAASAPSPTNGNWIAAGHNLLPWLHGDRKYYYVTSSSTAIDADTSLQRPIYESYPFQLLFSDPDV